jgi:hypothetical protein
MLEPSVSIDFGSERLIPNLTDGLIYGVVPHVVSVKKSEDVVSDRRGCNIDVNDGSGVDLTVIGGAIEGKPPFYKGVRSIEVGPDVTRRRFTAGVSSDTERDERRPSVMLDVTVLTGRTLDSAVMTTRAEMYH